MRSWPVTRRPSEGDGELMEVLVEVAASWKLPMGAASHEFPYGERQMAEDQLSKDVELPGVHVGRYLTSPQLVS